ncbi:hypothetical protein L1987_33465 [Smallanthus sonchifolius]|uniref:Uncharacterized protein n=1 Tax=Smallanthus sonchifolius TaxID=185202 RepID=A0ACB9HSC0_9ASTR|nr:hypothetical protein L1987_33465 [Smallanthus sonchifolius]
MNRNRDRSIPYEVVKSGYDDREVLAVTETAMAVVGVEGSGSKTCGFDGDGRGGAYEFTNASSLLRSALHAAVVSCFLRPALHAAILLDHSSDCKDHSRTTAPPVALLYLQSNTSERKKQSGLIAKQSPPVAPAMNSPSTVDGLLKSVDHNQHGSILLINLQKTKDRLHISCSDAILISGLLP